MLAVPLNGIALANSSLWKQGAVAHAVDIQNTSAFAVLPPG